MQHEATNEIDMIRDSVVRVLSAFGGLEVARKVHEGQNAGGDLWSGLVNDVMIGGLTVPAQAGGFGLGPLALTCVARTLGRDLAPVPLVSTLGAVAPLAKVVGANDLLKNIATGAVQGVLLAWDFDTVTAELSDAGVVLHGMTGPVPDLPKANVVLVPTRIDGAPRICVLKAFPEVEHRAGFDPTHPVGRLTFKSFPVPRADVHEITLSQFDAALDHGRLTLAAEAAGAARGVFDLTLSYIAERRQFGRSIASFQAIKHRIARQFVTLNVLDALIDGAAGGLEAGDPLAPTEARAAWALARQVQHDVAAEAIQLHGGVGVTWEYAPHLYLKRARAQMDLPLPPEPEFAKLGQALIAGDVTSVPPVDDTPFRAEIRTWLQRNLTGRFCDVVDRGHAGDGETLVDLRKDWERQMAAGGWVGLGLPQEVGGRALSVADQVAFHEEYARAGGPGRMGHIGEGLVAPTLLAYGTKDQQDRHLPGILRGEVFWAQGYSEPSAGSDLAAVRCRAEQDPETGDWWVTGQKIWTSLAQFSDWIFVLARCDAGSVGRKGLIFLLMPLNQPGIEIRPIKQMGGGAEFNEVFFDGACAKACDVVGSPGQGWEIAMALLGFERGISTLGQQMSFAREMDAVVDLARRHKADHLTEDLGRAWVGLRAMRHGALRMLGDQAAGRQGPDMLGYKLEWSEWHRSLGDLAMRVLGPDAAEWSTDAKTRLLQQLYLFSRADTIYGGTSEIQLNIIAEQGLGMPREPRGMS